MKVIIVLWMLGLQITIVMDIHMKVIITFVKHYVEELPNGEIAMVTHIESLRYFNEIEFGINNLM